MEGMFSPEMLKRHAMLQQMHGAPAPASESAEGPQPGRVGPGPYAALLGGQGADLATTLMGRSRGMREMNPLGMGGVMAGKAAMMTLGPLLMRKLAKSGHPTAAKVMGYGVGAAGAVPAAMNARTIAKAR